ncbi:MAG: hypothetical protein DI539_28640 [Flavobacterium psychrophilum]|nr:MAG: hypothetical protein DI539_28640 [Flavobacterium psychrophilum]
MRADADGAPGATTLGSASTDALAGEHPFPTRRTAGAVAEVVLHAAAPVRVFAERVIGAAVQGLARDGVLAGIERGLVRNAAATAPGSIASTTQTIVVGHRLSIQVAEVRRQGVDVELPRAARARDRRASVADGGPRRDGGPARPRRPAAPGEWPGGSGAIR